MRNEDVNTLTGHRIVDAPARLAQFTQSDAVSNMMHEVQASWMSQASGDTVNQLARNAMSAGKCGGEKPNFDKEFNKKQFDPYANSPEIHDGYKRRLKMLEQYNNENPTTHHHNSDGTTSGGKAGKAGKEDSVTSQLQERQLTPEERQKEQKMIEQKLLEQRLNEQRLNGIKQRFPREKEREISSL